MRLTEMVGPAADGRVHRGAARAGLADAAPSGRVRVDAMARWLQDVAYADVEDAGVAGLAVWVVRRARLRVEAFPRFGETVSLSTWCSGLGRMWAERRTTVTGPSAAVEAVALWVHLDPRTGRPAPFANEELAVYGGSADGRRVMARLRHPPPPAGAARSAWRFRASDLDLAAHVNNAAYWEPLEEELLAGPEPDRLDAEIEYRTSAQPGDAVVLRDAGRLWVAAPDGELHASIVTAG
jgi:acyl-ACP thioesterase